MLFERSKISEKTKTLLSSNLSTALKESLHSGTEFWESSKTLKFLSESDYFIDEAKKEAGAKWPETLQKMKDPSEFPFLN